MKMYDSIPHYILKYLRRKLYPRIFKSQGLTLPDSIQDIDVANELIFNLLCQPDPCMISRFGGFELSVIANYLYIIGGDRNIWRYIQGYKGEWWWNENTLQKLSTNAGFWPSNHENAANFSKLYIEDSKQVDILGSWIPEERLLYKELINAKKVNLFALEPFFSQKPWTRALKGKKVLVVHPFVDTIKKQYTKRDHLFINNEILPEFELQVYKSVQSLNGNSEYKDWFEALHTMETNIDQLDFDIAIIGCGAYGLSLAAHIKRSGRKAVHLGGATQLLFGIKGNRWENPVKNMEKYGHYPDLMNEYWVRPADNEKPKTAQNVEGACYW